MNTILQKFQDEISYEQLILTPKIYSYDHDFGWKPY